MPVLSLTNSQVLILKSLLRSPSGLTREEIAQRVEFVPTYDTLGPVLSETQSVHPGSLTALRLVERNKYAPDQPVMYTLSPLGRQCAERYSARKTGAKDKVPADILNPVVLRMRPLKPYGIENFTDDDVKQIRSELPGEYHDVELASLRRQIMNQRKIGSYVQNQYTEPDWYSEYRESIEFKAFDQKVRDWYQGCAVCMSAKDTTVFHRSFDAFGEEQSRDGIELCPQCHKRNHKFVCEIPASEPSTFFQE